MKATTRARTPRAKHVRWRRVALFSSARVATTYAMTRAGMATVQKTLSCQSKGWAIAVIGAQRP